MEVRVGARPCGDPSGLGGGEGGGEMRFVAVRASVSRGEVWGAALRGSGPCRREPLGSPGCERGSYHGGLSGLPRDTDGACGGISSRTLVAVVVVASGVVAVTRDSWKAVKCLQSAGRRLRDSGPPPYDLGVSYCLKLPIPRRLKLPYFIHSAF